MTLKEFLKQNRVNLTDDQRLKLGKKIASVWDSQKRGDKFYIQEDGFKVIDYTISFLKQKSVIRNVIRFLTKIESEVTNG